jgi:hypothetical protein
VTEDVGAAYDSNLCYSPDSPVAQEIDAAYQSCVADCTAELGECNAAWSDGAHSLYDTVNRLPTTVTDTIRGTGTAVDCSLHVIAKDCNSIGDAASLVDGLLTRADLGNAIQRSSDLAIDAAFCEGTAKPLAVAACFVDHPVDAILSNTVAWVPGLNELRQIIYCGIGAEACQGAQFVLGFWWRWGCEAQRAELQRACQTAPCDRQKGPDAEGEACDWDGDGHEGTWEYVDHTAPDDAIGQLRDLFTPDNLSILGWWSTCECVGDAAGGPAPRQCPADYCQQYICAGKPAPLCTSAIPSCDCSAGN